MNARAAAAFLLLAIPLVLPATAEPLSIPVDLDVETGIVDVHVHETIVFEDVDDPRDAVDAAIEEILATVGALQDEVGNQSEAAQEQLASLQENVTAAANEVIALVLAEVAVLQAIANDTANGVLDETQDAQDLLNQTVNDLLAEAGEIVAAIQEVIAALQCPADPTGNANVIIPPLAAAAPATPGFLPGCVVVQDDGTLTFTHADTFFAHDPGSRLDLTPAASRCFSALRDLGTTMGLLTTTLQYGLVWRYDGTNLEVSSDGGATFRNCNLATSSMDSGKAVVPYRCDIHNGMEGDIVVSVAAPDLPLQPVIDALGDFILFLQDTAQELQDEINEQVQPILDDILNEVGNLTAQADPAACRMFSESTPGNGDTTMPPGAAGLGGQGFGFMPACVIIDDQGTFTIHSRDTANHNPGSVVDLPGGTAARCFQHLRDKGANQASLVNYVQQWRYDGTDLEISVDGGVTWRDCNAAKGTGTDATKAVVPYRCDIHTAMRGTLVVQA